MFGKELSGPVFMWGLDLYKKWTKLSDEDVAASQPNVLKSGNGRSLGIVSHSQLRKLWALKENSGGDEKLILEALFNLLLRKEFKLFGKEIFYLAKGWNVVVIDDDGDDDYSGGSSY